MTECGFVSHCGRPAGHTGHHGGWRTGITLVADDPVPREPGNGSRLGMELSAADLAVVAEYVRHGRHKLVAQCLGVTEQTIKNRSSRVLIRTGAESIVTLAWLLGWVVLPEGVTPHGD